VRVRVSILMRPGDARARWHASAIADAGHDVAVVEASPVVAVREVVRSRPDVVHVFGATMLPAGGVAARLARGRLVCDVPELPGRGEGARARFVEALRRAVIARAAAVVTASDG